MCNGNENFIFGTSVTTDYIERRLMESLGTSARFGPGLRLQRIGLKQGFFSVIARLYPDWSSTDGTVLPKSVVLKIPTLETWKEMLEADCCAEMIENSSEGQTLYYKKMALLLRQFHNSEVAFYELAASSGMNVRIPKVYVCERITDDCCGLIVMEDAGEDTTTANVFDVISVDEAKQVLASIAAVHAYSLQHQECLNIGENPPIKELMLQFDQPKIYADCLKVLPKISEEKLQPLCDELAEFGNIYDDVDFMDSFLDEIGVPYVLMHGDIWTPNVLWRKDGEKRELCAIIDWQDVCKGWAAEDISRFLTSSLSTMDRREHQDELLYYYFQELEKSFGKKLSFSFEQLKASYTRILPISIAINLPMLGPNYMAQIGNNDDNVKLVAVAKEKAVGLAEDLLYYLKLNKKMQSR